jgi:post-segregation antitoxin (ccd killing protein)
MSDPTPTSTVKAFRLNVSVDSDLHRRLRVRSVEEGRPLTVLIPRLLRLALDHLQQEEQQAG